MKMPEAISHLLEQWWPALLTLLIVIAASSLIDHFYVAGSKNLGRDTRLRRQMAKVGLNIAAIIGLVLTIPVPTDTQQQLLSLVGIVITAVLTLSSTTFVSNGMAGVMLRSVAEFNPGDFIRIGDHFGRITELGLLHTEIQTEDSDLATLPNLYLITHPFSVVRSHGTVISAVVSLGYDVPRKQVETHLLAAADSGGLTDAFVQITSLEDHAVCYRVAGKLAEVKQLISARSNLHKKILDHLHAAQIEIASPQFMNQRQINGQKFIPASTTVAHHEDEDDQAASAEDVIFDKADWVETVGDLKRESDTLAKRQEKLQKLFSSADKDKKESLQFRLDYTAQRIKAVDTLLAEHKAKNTK